MAIRLANQLLNQLLSDLGFQPGELCKPNHRAWRHPESGCVLFLPVNKLDQKPWPADIVGIRASIGAARPLGRGRLRLFCRRRQVAVVVIGTSPCLTPCELVFGWRPMFSRVFRGWRRRFPKKRSDNRLTGSCLFALCCYGNYGLSA